jgi:hypothetical protein
MPVSAGMHESGPLRQGEGADTLCRDTFPGLQWAQAGVTALLHVR